MSEPKYTSLMGAIEEACDIKDETGCTVAESFEIQSHLAALRDQEYRDAITEIEDNVIYGVDFINKAPKNDVRGGL